MTTPDPSTPHHLYGKPILDEVKQHLQRYAPQLAGRRVVIVRFEAAPGDPLEWQQRMAASAISALQKVRTSTSIGYQPQEITLPGDVREADLRRLLVNASQADDVSAVIVQFPPPPRLRDAVQDIEPSRDIDALLGPRSPHRACATADGVARLVAGHARPNDIVAVVGARGFVGSGVVRLLQDQGLDPIALDAGDDLAQLRRADVIVSATGRAGVLRPEHLEHRPYLVVDTGFVPGPPGFSPLTARGDVDPDAAHLPQRLTPVPGGVGPVEMAVLLERLVRRDVDPTLQPWRLVPGQGRSVHFSHAPVRETLNPGHRTVRSLDLGGQRPRRERHGLLALGASAWGETETI